MINEFFRSKSSSNSQGTQPEAFEDSFRLSSLNLEEYLVSNVYLSRKDISPTSLYEILQDFIELSAPHFF